MFSKGVSYCSTAFVSANPDYGFLELGSLPLTIWIGICITMEMIGNLFEPVFLYLSMSQIGVKNKQWYLLCV